jgi:hypothetical protein
MADDSAFEHPDFDQFDDSDFYGPGCPDNCDHPCHHDECQASGYCRYDPNELEREMQDHPERFYWPEDGGPPERW